MNMILYNEITGIRLTNTGATDRTPVKISYDVNIDWALTFVEENGLTPVDVSDAVAWRAAIDDDYDHSSEPMARTLNENIDSSQAASGIITTTLDTYTATYLAALGTSPKKNAYFELRGFNSGGKVIHEASFLITAYNSIDPEGESELDPPSDDASKTWTEALLSAYSRCYPADGPLTFTKADVDSGTKLLSVNHALNQKWGLSVSIGSEELGKQINLDDILPVDADNLNIDCTTWYDDMTGNYYLLIRK
jgi:hypothetical protein